MASLPHWQRRAFLIGGMGLFAISVILLSLAGCSKKDDLPSQAEGYYRVKLKKPGEG